MIWTLVFAPLMALGLCGQSSLEFFTNEANELLTSEFDFGITNIPVYSSTNTAIGYSAAIHYALQSAANDYDATTPGTNLPSVFRPQFSLEGDTLFVVGYTNVTTDFAAQISLGFKEPGDPTIGLNDNVWGIPWVVGEKNSVPTFNEYCYSTAVLMMRQLYFSRFKEPNGTPVTNRPPQYTNQFYVMGITNTFGVEAWNSARAAFTSGVTIIESNRISIALSNNYNWGTNVVISAGSNWTVSSWPGWSGKQSDSSFLVPMFTNVIGLPLSYWSESSAQFFPFTNSLYLPSNTFPAADMEQTGWPVHHWTLSITNNFMYALVDNASGQGLDFVNLGAFGSMIDINEALTNINNYGWSPPTEPIDNAAWFVGNATDSPRSPMSAGALNQIEDGMITNQFFEDEILGIDSLDTEPVFSDPYVPCVSIIQNCSWSAGNPLVRFTVEDLTNVTISPELETYSWLTSVPPVNLISNSVCTLGGLNARELARFSSPVYSLSDGAFEFSFRGVPDLPYALWATTNLVDWSQIGTALQPFPGQFEIGDPAVANYPMRFYEVRGP
jgi:hypothetical protein